MRLKISARKSDLARLQAYMVGDALREKNPAIEIEYRFKESLGDINLTDPLWKIPEKGVFTEDFYGELTRGETDMVVHSWKDLPTEIKSDTLIAATLPRADQRDLLLLKKSHFAKLQSSKSLKVFSSSPRREYNLSDFFKTHLPFALTNVRFENVRGNIPTRMRKLIESSEVDGLIVAKAALDRLLTAPQSEFAETQKTLREYLDQLEWTVLPLTINPNAAAQGALAIEILSSREDLKKLLATINHDETFQCAAQERKVLASFGGGCHQKIGVAALSRPYGQIQFLKGLSDQGQVLNKRELRKTTEVSQFSEHQLWWSDLAVSREPLPNKFLPENVNALFVARSEAWPENFQTSPSLCIWTAGLKTWKNLAQRGLWVHGCSEGLGEQEESRIEALTGSSLKWAKLSHEEGFSGNSAEKILIPTYKLITKDTESNSDFSGKESFFWNSGSQFLAAACKAPEILSKHHSCGPGNTYTIIRQYLEEKNIFTPSRLNIFLDQEDWRQQCTK